MVSINIYIYIFTGIFHTFILGIGFYYYASNSYFKVSSFLSYFLNLTISSSYEFVLKISKEERVFRDNYNLIISRYFFSSSNFYKFSTY